jgi:hypothetical protein
VAVSAHLFGVRHHGPGSARRLVEALDALGPAAVLIEGPADASDLLPMLADPEMRPPVALLAYAEEDPARASFFPFARYSPEYQAAVWAVRRGATLRFIDLPASDRLGEGEPGDAARTADDDLVSSDPIGVLADAAGYVDGESWWSDVIEENQAPGPVFAAVADAMTALREHARAPSPREAAREAHMRLEIARALRESGGPVAVVCGAWHVPALAERHAQAADRALLKGRLRAKVKLTWAPWTSARLAAASGYGAGVRAPGWFQHLHDHGDDPDRDSHWLARVAAALRRRGHLASTADLIEAQRLARALAGLRGRPHPGFEELEEAVIACVCFGERARWDEVAPELLIGAGVGAVPASTPLAPLLDDLQRQQKLTRLKPEALDRDLSLDLRSEAGAARSTLLHRLDILRVPWGRLAEAGRSRGTFRENWRLHWEPEFAVELVDNVVYGATIADAAAGRIAEAMAGEPDLGRLAGLVRDASVADLPAAVEAGVAALEHHAALTSDATALLAALPPMADVIRYGEARARAAEYLAALMPRVAVGAALALSYAARGLDAAAAGSLRDAIAAADRAIELAALAPDVRGRWHAALRDLLADGQATHLVVGAAARLLYERDLLAADEVAALLGRMLSPGIAVADAAGFFDGFFTGSGERLIHDPTLRGAVDAWLQSLAEDDFIANLPLFRRVFASLDATARRRLLDALFAARTTGVGGYRRLRDWNALWPAHEARVLDILNGGATP